MVPEHPSVDELIARARTLTGDERTALRRAYVQAWTPEREWIFHAARNAAVAAGRGKGWQAATGAFPYPMAAPVGVAAEALLVRDLIAVEHFDALYGHWASVVDDR